MLCCLPLFFVSAWWNRGIADEVTIASFCKAVTGTAVMARSANEEKKKSALYLTCCMASFGLVALFVFKTNSRPNNGSDDASGSSACQSGLRGS